MPSRKPAGPRSGGSGQKSKLKSLEKPDPRDPYRKPLIYKGLRTPGYSVPGAQTYAGDLSAQTSPAALHYCMPAYRQKSL